MTDIPQDAEQAFSHVSGSAHVLTIGNFDGVHRGHMHLISQVVASANEQGAASLVVTFEPHPVAVLRPDHAPARIATPERKVRLLKSAGIDEVVVIPFGREFASLEPAEFLGFIVSSTRPVGIHVGEGFRFGRMRAGNVETMRAFGETHGFAVCEVAPLTDDDGVVSSSRVRAALHEGDISKAEDLLGRRFRLTGEVEHGMARGRDLGYPTANLSVMANQCIPGDGIYAGYAHMDDEAHGPREALIYIGTSPTFGERERLVEVNILDYRGDLYSKELEVEFLARIRPDRVFEGAEALMKQMADDEVNSRALLAQSKPEQALKGD